DAADPGEEVDDHDDRRARQGSAGRAAQGVGRARGAAAERGDRQAAGRRAMSATPEVIVHRDAEVLAQAVAARLITRLVDVQALRGAAHVVLTGGTVGIKTLAAVA